MIYFLLVIFLSAFLIFQVQPMIAKYILPWFGGTSAVWSTVQMFFQVVLTAGYAYASWLTNPGKRREWIHIILLALSVALMVILGVLWKAPILPGNEWKPRPDSAPALRILLLLVISVGIPYFLLSSNSPLMQVWFYRAFPDKQAYKLYALSNVGSFVGLITYPLILEPLLPLAAQGWMWSVLYFVYAAFAGWGALSVLRKSQPITAVGERSSIDIVGEVGSKKSVGLWIGFAMTASVLLLATTSQITQEVAVIPFLWVLPLTIYLASFVLTFSNEKLYSRNFFLILLFCSTIAVGWVLGRSEQIDLPIQLIIYAVGLFSACMVCHGELYRLRPSPRHLTAFYLMVSIGGALGGIFVSFGAPALFKGYWELPLGYCLCWLLLSFAFIIYPPGGRKSAFVFYRVILLSALVFSIIRSYQYIRSDLTGSVLITRNFYGVIRVKSIEDSETQPGYYSLVHGITIHGIQYKAVNLRSIPTAYFSESGGGGLVLMNHPKYMEGMKVGILGLGIGTLAAYAQPGDVYRFYEINPLVIDIALGEHGYFSYLTDSAGEVEVIPGDARLSLEQEYSASGSLNYDVLILDVFSSDSIPVHLLNKEAFELYLDHMAPGGVLALHISNRHLDLVPVVWTLADHFGLQRLVLSDPGDGGVKFPSLWMLLTLDEGIISTEAIKAKAQEMDEYKSTIHLWTDDYNNLIQILK